MDVRGAGRAKRQVRPALEIGIWNMRQLNAPDVQKRVRSRHSRCTLSSQAQVSLDSTLAPKTQRKAMSIVETERIRRLVCIA
jgi:hypothetical protein